MRKLVIGLGITLLALLSACGSDEDPTPPSAANNPVNPPTLSPPNTPVTPVTPATPVSGNAIFQVGAAVVNIDPTTPVNVGGYSDKNKPAIQTSNDPLQVRAFVVAKGNKAVAFAVVDSTGWFAEYQEQEAGYGQVGARTNAASKLAARGFNVDRSAVMVSTTHSHATPTVTGIWGQMGPANRAYVKQVHDAVVAAVDQAASNLKPSELWFANGDIRSIVWQNGQGTNVLDGFAVDAQMPILWARDPDTGATNALYVSVPNHFDQFRPFNGAITQGFSADVPGYVRKMMDESVDGISVVAAGTLGRQEPPGKDPTYSEVARQGDFTTNAVRLAMAKARPLKSDVLASAENMIQASVGTTAGNQGLLSLMKYNASSGPFGGPSCNSALGGMCSIPRALTAPWCVGNCSLSGSGSTTLGTYVTALRIGPLLYVSNPGEAFPEVNEAIRSAVLDAQSVNVVGLAGDFLGYNWVPSDYNTLQFGSSDFAKYNTGPDLAQKTADAGYINAAALGFQVKTGPQTVHAVSDPTGVASDPNGVALPGIQFYPSQVETASRTINFYGSSNQPQNNYGKPAHTLSQISWDFGDNNVATSNSSDRLDHMFSLPGVYMVTAAVTDLTTSLSRSWKQLITINRPLSLSVKPVVGSSVAALTVVPHDGQGTLIAAKWNCSNGTVVNGLIGSCPNGSTLTGVTAMDGAGNIASLNPIP